MFRTLRRFITTGGLCAAGLLVTSAVHAQQAEKIRITGNIKDELKSPMPGVTVINQASKAGVNTDEKGNFAIDARRGDTLVARLIGYDPFVFVINKVIDFDITMKAGNSSLNEVVVVGFGQQKKISLVGAQSTVKVEDLKQPVANLSATLAGRIAGMVGVQRSGLPGSNGADLWIRGISTFNASNSASPLIVVDGVQGRDLNGLDPEDIASFTILKDAAATAMYGVAGGNGVILIQTKRGTAGKPTLMVNYNQGITSFTKRPELTDGVTYMMLRNEAQRNTGMTPEYSNNYINSTILKEDPNLYPDVDWMSTLFQDVSQNRRANFSSRGGSENATFYVGLSYFDEESLLRTDKSQTYDASTRFKRYNFTSNVSMNWTSTTKFDLGLKGYITNFNRPQESPNSAFGRVMQTNPVLYPVMYTGGFVPAVNQSEDAQPNPYGLVTQSGYTNAFGNQIYSDAKLSQDLKFITEGLSAYVLYSFDVFNSHEITRGRRRSTYMVNRLRPYNSDGTMNLNVIYEGTDDLNYSRANNGNRKYYTEAAINYDKDIDANNHITATVLYNQHEEVGAFATSVTSSLPYRRNGISGRATYSHKDRYFFETNFGYNGSENFAPQNRFGFFPSFGVGWVLSNEEFFKPLVNAFPYFKLRYSDGFVGSGAGGRRFGFMTIVNPDIDGFTFGTPGATRGVTGLIIQDYGTNITWAESRKQNLGIEFNTIGNHLHVMVDFFKEKRTNVFLQRGGIPAYVGLMNMPWGNLGIIENKGIDGTLELQPIKLGKDFQLDMRGTFTFNNDKVIENDQPKQPFDYMERRGHNLLSRWGYVALGLFEDADDIAKSPDQSRALGIQRPGDIKYADLNGDGIIDQNDQTRIGRGDVPHTIYGLGFNLTWKNFYLGAFFQGVYGADRLLSGDGIIPFNNSTGAERSNLFLKAEDRWTEDNPRQDAFYPRLAYGNNANKNNAVASTWWVKDISFLRLKTMDLGYNLPKGTLKSIGVKNARIYLQGVNLLYFSKFDLWDPELNTSNGTAYPNTRSLNIGVQANF